MKFASFTVKRSLALHKVIATLVLAFAATAIRADPVVFINPSHTDGFDFSTLITATGQEIALEPGSHIEFPTQHLLWGQWESGPGVTSYSARFWGSFVIYAGLFGLPASTAVISGRGFTDYEYSEMFGITFSRFDLYGTILSVNPVLLANLGYPPHMTGGDIYAHVGDPQWQPNAEITFGPATVPEPASIYLIGAACLAMIGGLRSRA